MDRWCVTREDLHQFKRLVQQAVQEGHITPTDQDPFDPTDCQAGPNVHTVNSQFIMPVTRAAGGASWALMQHPEGLFPPCDLFVTHAWSEGIYEFVDKVLHSWPREAQHAYCCMLSNPQNSDMISGLLEAPMDSPFAQALRSATHVLVVPNRFCSIYTRVWCAYEAFLGYTWGKLISTASAPIHDLGLTRLFGCFVCLLGFGVGGICSAVEGEQLTMTVSFLMLCLLCCAWLWFRERAGAAAFRILLCGCELVAGAYSAGTSLNLAMVDWGPAKPFMLLRFVIVVFGVPCVLETDRLRTVRAAEESRQLRHGFTGKLCDAKCSLPADGEHIRRELQESGSEAAVDEAVSMLISMGMSSPHLRKTVRQTGTLGNVSRWSRTISFVAMNYWAAVFLLTTTWAECQQLAVWPWAWLVTMEVGAGLVLWVALFAVLPEDRKAFAVASLVGLFPVWLCGGIEYFTLGSSCSQPVSLACLNGPMVTAWTLLGPARVAKIPVLGPALVRALLGQRRQWCGVSKQ